MKMIRCLSCGFNNDNKDSTCKKCKSKLLMTNETGLRQLSRKNTDVAEPYNIITNQIIQTKSKTYKFIKKLGEGGFATVYLVLDNVGKKYALKILDVYRIMPQDQVEIIKRFRREYDFGVQINSNFTVKAYDWGIIEGNPFYIMNYCQKGSLSDKINEQLTEVEVNNIALGILHGLNDLHKNGCIHRDLKPDNILFNENDVPLLSDFGISAYINNRITRPNWLGKVEQVWGTVQYMPPEQFDNAKAFKLTGPYTDIFAFGVTFFELISHGKMPFGSYDDFANNPQLFANKVKKGEFLDLKQLNPNMPQLWLNVIQGCLEPNYQNRFKNVKDIIKLFPNIRYPKDISEKHIPLTLNVILKIMNGEENGKCYNITYLWQQLGKRLLTIGWYDKNNPNLNDIEIVENTTQYISRRHATLELFKVESNGEQHWFIRDGQFYEKNNKISWYLSTNGVLINSNKVSGKGFYLKYGDIITIGDTTLKVEQDG